MLLLEQLDIPPYDILAWNLASGADLHIRKKTRGELTMMTPTSKSLDVSRGGPGV